MDFAKLWSTEIIKFRTLPSNVVTVSGAVVLAAAIALGMGTIVEPDGTLPAYGGMRVDSGGSQVLASGMQVVLYAMMVLGVLSVTGELRAGTLRVTMSMAPWRGLVYAAKLASLATIAAATALAALLVEYVAALITAGDTAFSPFAQGGVFHLVSFLFTVPLMAIMGAATGLLLRNGAGAISALFAWAFAAEGILTAFLPQSVYPYLPFVTIGVAAGSVTTGPVPFVGLLLFAGYTAVMAAVAYLFYKQRDVG